MKFSTALFTLGTSIVASCAPVSRRSVEPSLVIDFGIIAGQNPNGSGSCTGLNGVLIPCQCPPPLDVYIQSLSANVAAGHDVNNPSVAAPFPTDSSIASQITRLQTQISSLQNLNGSGVGCPAAATTWNGLLASLLVGTPEASTPTVEATTAVAATTAVGAATSAASTSIDPSLIVDFGVIAGQNPNGGGSCTGTNNVLIPCTCPPSLASYTASLEANVAAGHDLNNPSVPAPFPTDSSLASQITRLQTQLSTLQNLNGTGVGCPAASTIWSAQLASLIAEQ
uniref:Uncharacterized protein n=1 Tax=Mycena chlorophos TaxID=658473 RepID=A0ABQ0LSK9_MYCCL|nr:predicted protein [Mycena chlorophos]